MALTTTNSPTSTTGACADTVHYDGACPVCSREIAMYQREPGGQDIRWIDVTRCDAEALGDGLTREAALARLHLRSGDGRLVSGAAAFTGMWRQLPRWRWLGRLFGSGWRLSLLEFVYRAFLGCSAFGAGLELPDFVRSVLA